ncbi:hypothetical protein Q8W71_30640 [Methylobacterium sp. NEAU 140]|nr:hypothetical protein [Methylobacterium sp. NEAU 140]MDP4026950.1 hypothetical protein [Methylobacterium sp. NEAU 140]
MHHQSRPVAYQLATRIANHPAKRLSDLLPWNWTPALPVAHAA